MCFRKKKWYTGTVQGAGFHCGRGEVKKYDEYNMTTDCIVLPSPQCEVTDSIWNNVSYFVPWIRDMAIKLDEELNNCDGEYHIHIYPESMTEIDKLGFWLHDK